jgi:hypothetical protein
MKQPLMPLATAVWLVDNTSLTFEQIANFCGLHALEVQSIADEQIATNIVGLDPVANGQLPWAEIERCQKDPNAQLKLQEDEVPAKSRAGGPRYTPVSKRQDRPDAIAWLIRHHPELSEAQICKLVGTTKPTIAGIRHRTHWNISNIKPVDPVALGLCKQLDLDAAIAKANEVAAHAAAEKHPAAAPAPEVVEE